MWRYTLRRLAFLPLILIAVSIITFFLVRVLPGDPAAIMTGPNGTEEQREAIREQLGLNKPIFPISLSSDPPFITVNEDDQFTDWLSDLARGDLGTTYYGQQSIAEEVKRRLPASAELIILSLIISVAVGVALGVLSAVKRNSGLDYSSRTLAVLGQSIPDFFLLILLILIPSVLFNYAAPGGGYVSPLEDPMRNFRTYFPPALVLGIGGAAGIMRLQRTTMLEVLRSDYVRTARAKGLSGSAVVMSHAFRNTLAPLVTIIGTAFTAIFAGSVIAEQILSIDGLGVFFLRSTLQKDLPVIQFLVLYTATVVVLVNLIVDLSYAYIDPRVRYR